MLCDSSNLHKQKLVKPKPLASKMAAVKKVGQKNGEVELLVEYLFCDTVQDKFGIVPKFARVVPPVYTEDEFRTEAKFSRACSVCSRGG